MLLVIALAFAIRIPPINEGLPNDEISTGYYRSTYSLWIDEAEPLFAVSNLDPFRFDFDPDVYLAGTLQVYLFAAALQVADLIGVIDLVSDKSFYLENPSEIAPLYLIGRLITLVFGVATVYAVFLLTKNLYGSDGAGILSALFLAILPSHVIYSYILKADPISVFFVVMTALFSANILKSGSWRWYVLAGIAAGLAAAAKYPSGSAILFLVLAHVIRAYSKQPPTDAGTARKIVRSMWATLKSKMVYVGGLTSLLAYFMAFPYLFLKTRKVYDYIHSHQGSNWFTNWDEFGGWISHLSILLTNVGLPIFALSMLGLLLMWRRGRPGDLLLLSWTLTFFVVLGLTRSQELDRATMPLLPFLAVAASQLCVWVYRKLPRRSKALGLASYSAFALVVVYSLGLTWSYVEVMSGEDVRFQAVRWINTNIPDGASIGFDLGRVYNWHIDYSRYNVDPFDPQDPQDELSLSKYDVIVLAIKDERLDDEPAVHFENSSLLTPLRLGRVPLRWEQWYTWEVYIYTKEPVTASDTF